MKKLVIFDFDGTITKRDSMLELTRFYHGFFRYFLGLIYLSPLLVLYKLGWIPNWKAKQAFLTYFFGGIYLEEFQKICGRFCDERLPQILRPKALEALESFNKRGDKVLIVSASAEHWLQPWAALYEVYVIASRLEVHNGRITGKLAGKNCYGPEKILRLKAVYDLDNYTEIVVFGDSRGDKELFQLGTTCHYKPFRN